MLTHGVSIMYSAGSSYFLVMCVCVPTLQSCGDITHTHTHAGQQPWLIVCVPVCVCVQKLSHLSGLIKANVEILPNGSIRA